MIHFGRMTNGHSADETQKLRLDQLRERLLAANLRSRTLRIRRLSTYQLFDLTRLESLNPRSLEKIVRSLDSDDEVTIDLLHPRGSSDEETAAAKDLRRLADAARWTWQEVGERELLLGWPILEGKLNGVWLRAPLLLYPIRVEPAETGRLRWQLTLEGRPDLNEVLTQTIFRLTGSRLTFEDLVALDEDGRIKPDEPSWSSLVGWLAENGLPVDRHQPYPELNPIPAVTSEEVAAFEDGSCVVRNHLVLGRFPQSSSQVLSEYNDLDSDSSVIQGTPASEILAVDFGRSTSLDEVQEEPTRGALPIEAVSSARILSSDASQEYVLRQLEQAHGEGLVVRGPPGTGKSQLIANLIGRAIEAGERVLVVCQKRAALDVVAERLSALGLGDALATVHDVHRDRAAFSQRVVETVQAVIDSTQSLNAEAFAQRQRWAIAEFEAASKRLSTRLSTNNDAFELFASPLFGETSLADMLESLLDDDHRLLPDLSAYTQQLTPDLVIPVVPELELLAPQAAAFAAPNPLSSRKDWSKANINELREAGGKSQRLLELMHGLANETRATTTPGQLLEEAEIWRDSDTILSFLSGGDGRAVMDFCLYWTFSDAGLEASDFQAAISLLHKAKKELTSVPIVLYEKRSEELVDWISTLDELEELLGKWWRFLSPRYWGIRNLPNDILSLFSSDPSVPALRGDRLASLTRTRELCRMALLWHELFRSVQSQTKDNPAFEFGCSGQLADIENALAEIALHQGRVAALRRLHQSLSGRDHAYKRLPDFGGHGLPTEEPFVAAALADWRSFRAVSEAEDILARLSDFLEREWIERASMGLRSGRPDVELLTELIDVWPSAEQAAALDRTLSRLPSWGSYFLRKYVAHGDHGLERDLDLATRRAWCKFALGDRTPWDAERPLVDPTQRDGLKAAYGSYIEAGAPSVHARYLGRLRGLLADRDGQRALKLLQKDAAKKRYRLSIRQIVDKYWDSVLSALRPVWLCSPESVAALFPLRAGLFDRVVMDEASQCPVESALPALIRGRVALIAGDEKQMPPSHFFERREEADGDEESEVLAADSILDISRIAYPGTSLRFHYRSRWEELITFSNHAFYGGQLVTAPPADNTRSVFDGLQFHRVDGLWEEQTNRAEAQFVVDRALSILNVPEGEEPPSVGIVTFNQKQQTLVEELLSERAIGDEVAAETLRRDRKRPATETLFVKNLENVQGDERDVILFSIGYGPAEAGGPIFARFGPVGQAGGEKRLNVAFTRAKRGVIVACSFDPNGLRTEHTKNDGPKLLKAYLEYSSHASDGNREGVEAVLARISGDRREVKSVLSASGAKAGQYIKSQLTDRLIAEGLDVANDYGIGPYRLDLAVRVPGASEWGCGVDCTRFLRVIDPLQREITENLFWERCGWNVLRVGPGAWMKSSDSVVAEIAALARQSSRRNG
ncbi:MAG: hypothetical protein KC561_01375 [Myxococcales bacterium]|nr:hypothetical protein [Myxococcales bacterium]